MKRNLFSAVLLFLLSCRQFEVLPDNQLLPRTPNGRTWVVLPDTQDYSKSDENIKVLRHSLEWIRRNRKARNIEAVFQVGDLVNDNRHDQWGRIHDAFQPLANEVPLFVTTGNHDLGPTGLADTRETKFHEYFNLKNLPQNRRAFRGSFEKGKIDNAYYEISTAREKTLFFALEFGPRDAVLDWVKSTLARPEYFYHRAVLITHEFMEEANGRAGLSALGQRSTRETYGNAHHYKVSEDSEGANTGQEIWNKILRSEPRFEFVFSGHYDHLLYENHHGGRIASQGVAKAYRNDSVGGHLLHQFMYNAQWVRNGGDGWLLIVELAGDGRSARVQSFSPWIASGHPPSVGASSQGEWMLLDRR